MSYPDLTQFKALSFDCYGTLIDWEPAMLAELQPLVSRLPSDSPGAVNPTLLAQRVHRISAALQVKEPKLRYDLNLSRSFKALAEEKGVSVTEEEAAAFASHPAKSLPFADTIRGLEILKKYYKLIIISNIDDGNMIATLERFRPSVEFDAVYTAQQMGCYKPSHASFEFLFTHAKEELNIDREKGELLHVARSLTADHVTSTKLGLRSVWISRGGETKDGQGVGGDYEKLKGEVNFEWRFDSIGDFSQEVERQFRDAGMAK